MSCAHALGLWFLVMLKKCFSKLVENKREKTINYICNLPRPTTSLGYAFLLFQEESSVQALIDACIEEDGKLYLCVSSPTIKDKPVSKYKMAFRL